MKILIANDGPTAFYYIRTGLARAFSAAGHDVIIWDIDGKSPNDAFDEFEPDLFLGQTYNTTRSVCDAIKERPHMKVIMKAGDWGPLADEIVKQDYGVLMASPEEQARILALYEETGKPDYLHIYYHPNFIKQTHGHWRDKGIPVHCHMLAADVFDYTNGVVVEEFKSDITFIGGYWPYKARNIDDYLLSLCRDYDRQIKIFGNAHWPVAQYCGPAPTEIVRNILASAIICPQIHEPHSTTYGFDMSERTFKLLANKCFCISDYVAGLDLLFNSDDEDTLVLVKNPAEFKERIDYFLSNPDDRLPYIEKGYNKVMEEHTYFHRARDIFLNLGWSNHADALMKVYADVKKRIDNGEVLVLQ